MPETYRLNEGRVSYDTFDDEAVVIHFSTGKYFSMKGAACRLWVLLAQGHSVEQVTGHLASAATAGQKVAEGIRSFVDRVIEQDLLEPAGDGPAEDTPIVAAAGDQAFAEPGFEAPSFEVFDDMHDLIVLDPIHDVDDTGWPERSVA
ncbi:MAG: PqqD family protein [Planctomycetota bacterium]